MEETSISTTILTITYILRTTLFLGNTKSYYVLLIQRSMTADCFEKKKSAAAETTKRPRQLFVYIHVCSDATKKTASRSYIAPCLTKYQFEEKK